MIGLIINIDHLSNHKEQLKIFLPKLNINKKMNMLFVLIPMDLFDKLELTKIGTERLEFVNSSIFLNKIIYHTQFLYQYDRNAIILQEYENQYIQYIIDAIYLFFENEVTIVSQYNPILLQYGFINPYLCNESDICILKPNIIGKPNIETVNSQIKYIKQQSDNKFCELIFMIDRDSVDYLKHLCKAGVTFVKGRRSQKEFFGSLQIIQSSSDLVHTLSIDHSSVRSGNEDKIVAEKSLFTFHTHPFQAYLKYKVDYGIPSVSDYIATYTLIVHYKCVVHFVSSLEGLYTISINPESKLLSLSSKDIHQYIKNNFDQPEDKFNLDTYIDNINSFGLFVLQLTPWEKIYITKIKINFFKSGTYNNCAINLIY